VDYGYFHGYTLAEKRGIEPAFAFGFGLGYTRFACSDPRLDRTEIGVDGALGVAVDVTNTGDRAGEEVVQLYVAFPESRVERPRKLLRGFEKVSLAPRETRAVRFSLATRSLAYYDVSARAWRVEEAEHRVLVGASSRASDLKSAVFRVRGTAAR
jgi:beta-glucosidase